MKLLPVKSLLVIDEQEANTVMNSVNLPHKGLTTELVDKETDDNMFNIITIIDSNKNSSDEFKVLVVSKDFLRSNISEPMRCVHICEAAITIVNYYCSITDTKLSQDEMKKNIAIITGILYDQYCQAKENFNERKH